MSADARAPERPSRRGLLRVLLVALVVRVVWALWVPVIPLSDCNAYTVMAKTLAEHGVYGWAPGEPAVMWPVGTSFVYSLVFRAFGFHFAPVVVLNVLVDVAIVGLAYAIARRWFGGRVAFWSGMAVALWPTFIEFSTIVASEHVCILGLLAVVWVWDREDWKWWRRGLVAGVACAVTAYMRPTFIPLTGVLAVAWMLRGRRVAPEIGAFAVSVVVMLACFAPWTYRNYRTFGEPVLISCNSGRNLWLGNNPTATGLYQDPPQMAGMGDIAIDAELKRQAVAYIKADPVAFVKRALVKAALIHERMTIGVAWNASGLALVTTPAVIDAIKWTGQIWWMGVLAAGLAGAVVLVRRERSWRALAHPSIALWAFVVASYSVFFVADRYLMPVVPFIAMLGAFAIEARLAAKSAEAPRPATAPSPVSPVESGCPRT